MRRHTRYATVVAFGAVFGLLSWAPAQGAPSANDKQHRVSQD